MAILTKDQILKANDIKIEKLEVPEWGGTIFVRGLSGTERDKFEASIIEQRGKNQTINMKNIRAKLAVMSICDEKGNLLFEEADIFELAKKSAVALNRVFDKASDLSGLSNEDVKSLAKNSESGVSENSTSD